MVEDMASYHFVAMMTENCLLPWPQPPFSRPYSVLSSWTATIATVLLLMTFFAQITAVVIMTEPTINIRELIWSNDLRSRFWFAERFVKVPTHENPILLLKQKNPNAVGNKCIVAADFLEGSAVRFFSFVSSLPQLNESHKCIVILHRLRSVKVLKHEKPQCCKK
ncbi:uncharacterized protein CDAR_469211 [Caerostris darwini]|uniref:Uncharacterized protein n=1 Tax=Caerostris darwini TaxID=1538125 RepID=A0AAV4PYR6_9ARAC|nr:uncharacterized protein CDAR_469211 [Caerostris darwini]